MIYKIQRLVLFILIVSLIGGCSSLGKGIVEGLIENAEKEDLRTCRIYSKGFKGIKASLDKTDGATKVIMVHGVGHHLPGYSTILIENLMKELEMQVIALPQKNLTLADPDAPSTNLGNLRLTRLFNKDKTRELLFYELTWSSISDVEKKILEYDNSGEQTFRRAEFNAKLKKFSNDAIADPMIYLGEKQETIQKSVSQSYCRMISHGWNDFPADTHEPCTLVAPNLYENAEKDDYIFISHSLGSRITIDALERLARVINNKDFQTTHPGLEKLHHAIQDKEITIFMLSNQLPLLQLGRKLPDIVNKEKDYCRPNGIHYEDRLANETHIVAFSDPNDFLSYTIPTGYKYKYLDSRMCAEITNISLNIAYVVDVFGFNEFASPLEAHVGYDNDERVIKLLVHGLRDHDMPPMIKDRCEWVEVID